MSFIKSLQKNINKVTEGYFANWTPDTPISVGDYGDISGYRFTKDGNVSRFISDVKIERIRSETATFEKKDGIVVKAAGDAKGDAAIGMAKFDLLFGSEGSFLYHLKDLTNIQFKERREEFGKLGSLILSGKIKWKDDYVLVTEVKQAERALILVADSANARMEIEYSSTDSKNTNLASMTGNIHYARDSDKIIRFEVEQNTSLLFRVVGFTEVPPGGGPNNPLGKMLEKLHDWFSEDMPEPESIHLRDYVENGNFIQGTFELSNGELITLCQKVEDIDSFIQRSERVSVVDEEGEVAIEKIQMGRQSMSG